MREFMLYIQNASDAKEKLTPEEHLTFIKKCQIYINELKESGSLIAAQPLIREGVIISKDDNKWKQLNLSNDKETQVGYYHILAKNIDDAIIIAKSNPEFEYVPSAKIEIRPVKVKEQETNFVYPTKNSH
ncbi:YciI family protein [Chryseobacterium sp. CT-SW4]|uniref:YciI family protein n=1 Tax=Chryseobacterium sp. SW-1 TaxID=3157343 RepID=UPI003B01135B